MHGGGSAESLFQLLSVLDRSRFDPVVVFSSPIPARQRIAGLGIETHLLEHWYFSRQRSRLRSLAAWMASALVVHGARWMPRFCLMLDRFLTSRLRRGMVALIRHLRIDLVHTNNNAHRDLWAIEASALAGVPCVAHLRSFHSLGFSAPRAALANRLATAFVGYSSSIIEHWADAGLSSGRMHLVHNAIGDIQADPVDLEANFGIPVGAPVLGIVGRVIPERGHDFLIRALPRVLARLPALRLLVVGDGDPADKSRLAELARTTGVSEAVVFTGHRKDARGIIAALDALVLPYRIEPFGRTLLESWLLGTPVILSRVGQIGQIVGDGENALLFDLEDSQDLANTLIRLLEDPVLAARLAASGRQTCRARFSIEAQRDALQALYLGLLRPKAEAGRA